MIEIIELTVTVPRLLTVKEVAAVLRCSKAQTYGLIADGKLADVKVAGKKVCRAIDVNQYIQKCLEASGRGDSDGENSKHSDTPTTDGQSASDALSAHRRNKRLMR